MAIEKIALSARCTEGGREKKRRKINSIYFAQENEESFPYSRRDKGKKRDAFLFFFFFSSD